MNEHTVGRFFTVIISAFFLLSFAIIASGAGPFPTGAAAIKDAAKPKPKVTGPDDTYKACKEKEAQIAEKCQDSKDIEEEVDGVDDGKNNERKKMQDKVTEKPAEKKPVDTKDAKSSAPQKQKTKIECAGKGKLEPTHTLTPYITAKGEVQCRTQIDVANMVKNAKCANMFGDTEKDTSRSSCLYGLTAPLSAGLTREEVLQLAKKKGIQCVVLEDQPVSRSAPGGRFSKGARNAASSVLAAVGGVIPKSIPVPDKTQPPAEARFRICRDDQGIFTEGLEEYAMEQWEKDKLIHKASYTGTASTTKPGDIAEAGVVGGPDTKPDEIKAEPKSGTKPAVDDPLKKGTGVAKDKTEPARPTYTLRKVEPYDTSPGVAERVPTETKKTPAFVAYNTSDPMYTSRRQQTTEQAYSQPTSQRPAYDSSPGPQISQRGPYTQQTGVQPSRDYSPPSRGEGRTYQGNGGTNYRQEQTASKPWYESWFGQGREAQQQSPVQRPVVLAQNTEPQPWFLAEMKRVEEEKARIAAEKKQLEEQKKQQQKDQAPQKKTGTTIAQAKSVGSEKASTVIDADALFRQALVNAPSIEEIAQQYEEERKAEEAAYKKEKDAASGKEKSTAHVVSEKAQRSEPVKTPVVTKEILKKNIIATSDITKTNEAPFNTSPSSLAEKKSTMVTLLDTQAEKRGVQQTTEKQIDIPEKLVFTRTPYTVVVPKIRVSLKEIVKAQQRGEFTQIERDKQAAQLLAISEQLAGAAYGADYDTSQVLNDAARATELGAFMVAEQTDSKTVIQTLMGAYGSLAPLLTDAKNTGALKAPSGSVSEWSEQHFALIKYKIQTALDVSENEKARALYQKALSLVNTAELYKKSDQKYWNSSADMKEAISTIALAAALDRSQIQEGAQTPSVQSAVQKAKAREALLKDKGQNKGIWSSLLNMLGL